MCSYGNLVVIMLTLGSFASGLELSSLDVVKREIKTLSSLSTSNPRHDNFRALRRPVFAKIHRPATTTILPTRTKVSVAKVGKIGITKVENGTRVDTAKTNKLALIHDMTLHSKKDMELRHRRIKTKRRRKRMMMALLLAYKLKFALLVPAIVGGLILLTSTTALAGFFFALFAAVLGLKGR